MSNQFTGSQQFTRQQGDHGLVLQKQLPASKVPRFNPHPPEKPPQLRPVETPNKYSPVKRQYGKMKDGATAQSNQEDFSQYNIEELLLTTGVEFRNPEKVAGGWLPLEAYDDREFDTRLPQDWLRNNGMVPREGVAAQGLWKDKDGLCYWRRVRLQKWLPRSERFEGYWENTKEMCRLARIYVLFDSEDPRIFARRFKQANLNREHADALIKYNYYIENIPKHQIPEIDHIQESAILDRTETTKALRGKTSADTTTLMNEVNIEFKKTMNQIIFDKYLKEKGTDLITGKLKLPAEQPKGEAPYLGMIKIPKPVHPLTQTFSEFVFRTLQVKHEVIKAQQEIRKECNDVAAKDIYNPNITKTMKVEEFKQIQKSSISQTSFYLRETWINRLKEIITIHFSPTHDMNATGGFSRTGSKLEGDGERDKKSWFNLSETNREVYEHSKLKKFLLQQKFVMQDTLYDMTRSSVDRYVDSILSFLPITCKVIDSNTVEQAYYTTDQIKTMGAPKPKFPLFQIDLQLSEENRPEYSHDPEEVVDCILKAFDSGLQALQDIIQLEQKLMPHLFKSNQKSYLKVPIKPSEMPIDPDPSDKKVLPDENKWVYEAYARLRSRVYETVEPLKVYLKTYDKYEKEYKLDPAAHIKKMDDQENPPEAEALRRDVLNHQKEAQRLMTEIPESIVVSMFKINCREIRNQLADKHRKIVRDEIELISKMAKRLANQTMESFDKINIKIESTPKDIEELSGLKDFMAGVPNEIEKLEAEIKHVRGIYEILNEFHYEFQSDEDYDKQWRLVGSPLETVNKISKQHNFLDKEKEKFVNLMHFDQTEFETKVTELSTEVSKFTQYVDINQFEHISAMAKGVQQRLQGAIEQAKTFNNREALTGQEETAYENIYAMAKDFSPLFELWTTVELWRNSHKGWLHDDLEKIDAQFLEETTEAAEKTMSKVIRAFREREVPQILSIAEMIKEEVLEFKPHVPMACALRTDGMKDRHWEQISNIVGFEVKPYEGFTFQNVLDMNLQKYSEQIVDVGDKAGKEYKIECELDRMKKEWESVEFTLKPFKKSGTFTVLGFDDAQTILDDHQVLTQTMQFSPFKGPFEDDIKEWNDQLIYVSDTIEAWVRCQQQWMYLQPIFDSPDINKQMPGEAKRFKGVDKNWKEIIHGTKQIPNVLKTCTRENVDLKLKFEECNNDLDKVQSGLKDYLESKRAVFARFYFLSNDDLLEILSQTKEVENVRPHLRKVFENMADLEFQLDKTIIAMYSGERERIEWIQKVDPKDKQVQNWMGEVENMMYKSVRHVLKYSIDTYHDQPRTEWILQHAGQCVLNGSQVHWTQEVEEAIIKTGYKGVQEYFKTLDAQLLNTVELVRRKLTKLQSITLGALIVIDVHAKDVVKKLADEKIDDVNAFEWISQLRYYWEEDECRVKCIQTDFPYGYEYLGNTQRLVITPLTDKCYMTLMGALKLDLGGAPAGPAGTGKTESTKDLAKALAKQCVVFNCSDGMDYIMIGKFFKGLAAAGAWCCFDEFNRINIEVLSVIAQQLLQLFKAKSSDDLHIIFEESEIDMKPTFCVFITMNPGYAGRTELPDNLKALFRPVAMMVPDYALIGQIMLYSFGFKTADQLANKMVTTFKLASEQLSSQDHYDYGMRAVRSVINAAGLLKRAATEKDTEDTLLLRALRDVNVPKFLKDDLPLFENIIKDLFPNVQKPEIDYGKLMIHIKKSCKKFTLQTKDIFLEKIIQLYDTTQVRHGLMLVGPTGGGKTSNYRVLADALTSLCHDGEENYFTTHYHCLNPKSITMDQLYGFLEKSTGEWCDGVAAKIVADCAKDESSDRHWVMFDGPVDALWIESMNTVLDDNKKLCLNSGAIINLSDRMTMMFEVEDLAVASPATVSRCGMVYMEPGALGLSPLVKSWLIKCPTSFKERKPKQQTLQLLEKLYNTYLETMCNFIRKNCVEPVPTVNNNVAQSLMRLLTCLFKPWVDTELKTVSEEEITDLEAMLEPLFVFALVWSIGCTSNGEGRIKFSNKLKEVMGKDNKHKFPSGGSVYDYVYNTENKEWTLWTDIVKPYEVDSRATYLDIIVPTFDSIRLKYVKRLLLLNSMHVLSPGPTGTGKSINIANLINHEMNEDYQTIPITFSAQTSANQTQEALDEKFEKRRKGVFGPSPGKKFIIFIDDLNMPKKEEYGAQPPIELIRQWMDHSGWFDYVSKEKSFRKIEDIIFISAMGPPGGGRSAVTQRLQRHFNIITYTNLGKDSITMIFSKIVTHFLRQFSEDVSAQISKLIEATQIVYNGVENNLRPTPSKSHYTFNLRDMSKIFQGVCSAHSKTVVMKVDLIRLWYHENQRVFGDRMVSAADKQTLDQLCMDQVTNTFQLTREEVFEQERIIFGDFSFGIDNDSRPYQLIEDLSKMVKKIEEYLDDFNAQTKHPMKLVMFLDACDHVARICRILRQPQGNALLLGVGGSGRQSLSKLATFMSSYKMFQVEVVKGYSMRDWRDNLKSCLMQAGVDGKPTTFLFVDTQIINEQMLEDLNNILNSGDVPGLYKIEDQEAIFAVGKVECNRRGLTLNKMNMFTQYLNRVKANIHLIIAMSPLGEVFRTRLRKFPSLVNCCTIDWFTNWPTEALINVGRGAVMDADELQLGQDEEACIETFKVMHQSVEKMVVDYREKMRRISYVTPTSYLELLSMYKKILKNKRHEVEKARNRLVRGLEVLKEAAIEVEKMQQQLERDQPMLVKTQAEVEETKKVIAEETKTAEAVKAVVVVEEAEAAKKEAEVSEIKGNADRTLAKAEPALEAAIKQVKNIQVKDFVEMKSYGTPGKSIVTCFKIACFFLLDGVKAKKPQDPKKAEYDPEGYFELAKQRLLNNPKGFLDQLIRYEKDSIPDILVERVRPYMTLDEMKDENVKKASQALFPVKIWIVAMLEYHETLKIVNPMRETARQMGEKLAIVQAALAEKQAKVKDINDKLARLNQQQNDLIAKAQQLKDQMEDCRKRLIRADKMIGGLEGEKVRWTETVARLSAQQEVLVGDCLIAAGMICYAGPFIATYREELERMWREKIKELGIKMTDGVTMRSFMGNDVKIRHWGVAGLPSDNLSIENGIILFDSRRWPLMIDPQTQANKFVKNMGKSHEEGYEVFKLSDNNLIRGLEMAIQFGKWVLLENIGEELDPSLEPILLQQLTKQGTNWTIRVSERTLQYNFNFKLLMTTTLPNPHYSPETSVKVTILNFAITETGLEEQMLNLLVQLEMPDLQEKKNQIVEDNANFAKILYELEDKILAALSEAEEIADLLKDDNLINLLDESKKTSEEIQVRQAESQVTEKEIDVTREGFRPVAYRASLLFFCIVDLNTIDPMYQYSLQWFQRLFSNAVNTSTPSEDTVERIKILNDSFTLSLYRNVCRSLFEKHKLLFSFLLCTKILFGDNKIDMQEWRFFLAGPSGQITEKPNPTDWLDDLEWNQCYRQLYRMNELQEFEGILDYFIDFNKKFKKIFDSPDAHTEPLPGKWDEKLNSFQKMIILKAIRADKVTMAIQNFITEQIGEQYIKPPTFRLDQCYGDSSNVTPLVFVLSQGSDPVSSFTKFCEEMQMSGRRDMISLGQGQSVKAEKLIEEGKVRGQWVLLQNCHLSISWMPALEAIVDQLQESNHPDFRLWLTSAPTPKFPVSVLQNSVKMTMEPPTGLRSNLLQTYDVLTNKELNDSKNPASYKKLLFAFSFFHAIVQDRRKFGAIGWNIPYAFTYEDFDVCKKQLKIFLDEYENVPFKVLNYLGAEINYGGRVTDAQDIRLIKSILSRYIRPEIIQDGYALSDSGIYKSIIPGTQEDYIKYIETLPLNPHPEAFGLHENAEISTNQSATRILLENVLSIQPRTSSAGGKTRDQVISEIAKNIEEKTPPTFDVEEVQAMYPTDYNESMNTVLTQELIRYNRLLSIMKEMLVNIQKALIGEVVMSEELESMGAALFDNQIPGAWNEVGFLSLKPLASWINDLTDRVDFLTSWIKGGPPATYWISGFFFPQAFFTGTLQNYARKHVIAIDELDFEFKIYDEIQPSEVTEKPEDGCYVWGMFMEGARWNSTTHLLDDSNPKQLYTEVPLVWFLPKRNRKIPTTGIYKCPVYKVLSRAGTLSTTGHSTNFCIWLELPSKDDQEKWVRAGVAAFLALRY